MAFTDIFKDKNDFNEKIVNNYKINIINFIKSKKININNIIKFLKLNINDLTDVEITNIISNFKTTRISIIFCQNIIQFFSPK